MTDSTTILRGRVELVDDTKSCQTLQVTTLDADRPHQDVEHFMPPGISVLPSLEEECLCFEVNGAPDHLVVLGASQRGRRPKDLTKPGTGGLHYLGEWRVFMDDDGSTHFGKRNPSDRIALANKVNAAIQALVDATPVANDGGAALQAALITAWTEIGESVASAILRAE